MQVTIKETKEQPLLSRKQVTATVSFAGSATPSNAQIKSEIAKQTKAKEDVIVMKGLDTKFGSNSGNMKVYVYSSVEEKNKFELVTKHQKKQMQAALEAKKKAEEDAKKAAEEAAKKAGEEKAAAAEAAKAPAEETSGSEASEAPKAKLSSEPAEAEGAQEKPAEAAKEAPAAEPAKTEEPKAE